MAQITGKRLDNAGAQTRLGASLPVAMPIPLSVTESVQSILLIRRRMAITRGLLRKGMFEGIDDEFRHDRPQTDGNISLHGAVSSTTTDMVRRFGSAIIDAPRLSHSCVM